MQTLRSSTHKAETSGKPMCGRCFTRSSCCSYLSVWDFSDEFFGIEREREREILINAAA